MKRTHLIISLVMCIWGAVFLDMSEIELRNSLQFFNTGWLDAVTGIFCGVLFGSILRVQNFKDYLGKIPMGFLLTGVALGVIGLGGIGIGLVGASIIYIRFDAIELMRISLHASVVGLGAYTIYLTAHWGKAE